MQTDDMVSAISGYVVPEPLDPLRPAVAAYLSRYKGRSRLHAESELRAFLRWCEEPDVPPLAATRPSWSRTWLDAVDPLSQAVDGLSPVVGHLWLLPDLGHRR